MDLAIAAHAVSRDAGLWSLNVADFADIPGLTMVSLDRHVSGESRRLPRRLGGQGPGVAGPGG